MFGLCGPFVFGRVNSLREGEEHFVEQGRAEWRAQTSAPTIRTLMMRSRIREGEALVDVAGLGGFLTMEWEVRSRSNGP